jgi:subtilase family serine protease
VLDHVTVQNQGLGAAGPFRVTMDDTVSSRHESFTGLAPGATVTRTIDPPLGCHGWTSFVDDLNQVAETDETNNTSPLNPPPIC